MSKMEATSAVREFSRFYTNVLGLLDTHLLDTPYSLTEARVLFELARPDPPGALDLRRALNLDAGYLSRILARFEADGLVSRTRSDTDGRRQVIRLTDRGRAAFTDLDTRATAQADRLLADLAAEERRSLAAALRTAQAILSATPRPGGFVLRGLEPGDLGWVLQRHGARYAEEYGWDSSFEALVAGIVAGYAHSPHRDRENAWIAEVDGAPVGSVFCAYRDDATAQLRLLLVEPTARGNGIGARLVAECLRFAARAGYREIMLLTFDALADARRVYERAGFTLARQSPGTYFGRDLTEQVWRRPL
jgi:DNA-binding MarR family transcriptional regulator/N-acetylglutamate synthase-like GNAT family acetyltransferase